MTLQDLVKSGKTCQMRLVSKHIMGFNMKGTIAECDANGFMLWFQTKYINKGLGFLFTQAQAVVLEPSRDGAYPDLYTVEVTL